MKVYKMWYSLERNGLYGTIFLIDRKSLWGDELLYLKICIENLSVDFHLLQV